MKNINLILTFQLLLFSSCSLNLDSLGINKRLAKVTINSSPQKATIYQYDKKSKSFSKVGETPFEIEGEAMEKLQDFTAFKVEKTGFVVEHLLFDKKTRESFDYLIKLKAVETWSDRDEEVSSKLAGSIAKKVQSINRLVLKKKFNKALVLTEKLIEQYPKAHTFYDIKGSIYILKGQRVRGVSSLKKSLALNPENIETEKLIRVLERK